MPRIQQFDPGNLGLRPTDTGTQARAGAARRIGTTFNQVAGAQEGLARDTQGLARDTSVLARETESLGRETEAAGAFQGSLIADTGRRAGSAIADAGNAYQLQQTHQLISQGGAAAAKLQSDLTDQWDQFQKANPNDTSIEGKFREQVLEPALQQFTDALGGTEAAQQWAQAHAQALRNHFYEKTAADMSTRAGEAVATNYRQMVNEWTNTARKDPSAVDMLIGGEGKYGVAESSLHGLISTSPSLRGVDATKLTNEELQSAREAIVKSAARGIIERSSNPEAAISSFSDRYSKYINGSDLQTMISGAKAMSKANLLQDRQLQAYQRDAAVKAGKDELSKLFSNAVTFDENGRATIRPDIYRSAMETATKYPQSEVMDHAKTLINWAQAESREKRETIITDKPTMTRLLDGMFDPDNPTSDVDILKAGAERKLAAHDQSTLLALNKALTEEPLKGPIYTSTMTAVKGALGDSELGKENYGKFLATFVPEYLKEKRAGTLPPNALDMRDENSLIAKSLKPWRLTQQQLIIGHFMKNYGIGVDPNTVDLNRIGAPAAAPAPAAPATLPPVTERRKDQVYSTPRGPMKWTGTGWVSP